jgi:alkylation response protein AidB-like acyl-CoA dehydrogenase
VFEDDNGGETVPGLDGAVTLERVSLPPRNRAGADLALRATVLIAANLVGLIEAARDMATAYAKERQQFGQPIGAFQAIKHRCADMAVGAESAWTLTVFAALALDEGRADGPFQAAAARIVAGDAALAAARGNIQIHGGMGFTDECDAQLLVKRCHLWLQAGGDTRTHKAALMAEPEPVRRT